MDQENQDPTLEELEDLILSARYGELEEIQQFVARYGPLPLDRHVDEHGNSYLHMACANGHTDVVDYLLRNIKECESIHRPNHPPSSNTPLHWAALNHHLPILCLLCPRLTTKQICTVNGRGMSAMSEAMAGISLNMSTTNDKELETSEEQIPIREQCVNYLVEMMKLGEDEDSTVTSNQPPESSSEPLNQAMEDTKISEATPPVCLR